MPVTLLDELRGAWPPLDPIDPSGYVRASLEATAPIDARELPSRDGKRHAVAVAAGTDGRLALVPLVGDGAGWRRARAGDGTAAALVEALSGDESPGDGLKLRRFGQAARPSGRAPVAHGPGGTERAIGVDQTNESLIVGEAVVVKWVRAPSVGPHPAPALLAHLADVGFSDMPSPRAVLEWRSEGRETAVCAFVDAFLPDATDGWDWCVAGLSRHLGHAPGACEAVCDADIAIPLGALVARLHLALATPSSEFPTPVSRVGRAVVDGWREAAERTLAEAVALTDGHARDELAGWRPRMGAALAALRAVDDTLVQPVHGDLHVGQVLRWRGGYAVIDFDGNPTVPRSGDPAGLVEPQPAARDVAQMAMSIDHVGRVVDRRTKHARSAEVARWIARNRALFLGTYRDELAFAGRADLFDDRLLRPFEVEQECRELVYAARFLPRWRYAPMAALREMLA